MTSREAMLHARCPRCRTGAIFEPAEAGRRFRWPRMFAACPVCGLRYEREEGYFLGAMYISYGIGLIMITFFSLLIWWLSSLGPYVSVLVGLLVFLPFAPLVAIAARVLWIHFDQAVDPERE